MARRLLELYGDRFTTDFEQNKRLVMELTTIRAKKLRNRVAGYITRLVKRQLQQAKAAEEAQAGEEAATQLEGTSS